MSVYFITFRSVTLAQRGEGVLQKGGIASRIQRTPRWMEEQGCGYCLRVRQAEAARAAELLRSSQIPFRKIYQQRDDGRVTEAAL